MKNIIDMNKYLKYCILAVAVLGVFSCGDDDDDYPASQLVPELGIVYSEGSLGGEDDDLMFAEGDTAVIVVGLFSGRLATSDIDINWSENGGLDRRGTVTITEGTSRAEIRLIYPENEVINEDMDIELSISSDGDIPVKAENGSSISFEVKDDKKFFSLGNRTSVKVDTISILESAGMVKLPLNYLSSVNEAVDANITFTFEVDAATTAGSNTDYRFSNTTYSYQVNPKDPKDPSVMIDLIDDFDDDAVVYLKINLKSVTSSNEEVIFVDSLANSVVYKIENDYKDFSFQSGDTLMINSAGVFNLPMAYTGDLQEKVASATIDLRGPDVADVDEYFTLVNPVGFIQGDSEGEFSFEIDGALFTELAAEEEATTYYVNLFIADIQTTVVSDEVRIATENSVVPIKIIVPPIKKE
ncbi:hypothetical protein [Fulvivirga sediminis]|uniref:Uncharacterized protein n=1 Tax=Fulvivirga sediminis TaxID=2803949 RepID=A0A937K085_9BACT|nr:hypothetical protein [Fulvivirga sediminis]MBL3656051.1 hypothetical protein [Fulvivirga sediminis]